MKSIFNLLGLRQLLNKKSTVISILLVMVMGLIALTSCSSSRNDSENDTDGLISNSIYFTAEDDTWDLSNRHSGTLVTGMGTIDIINVGMFTFDRSKVETVRPDIFQPGYFSVFDALVQLDKQGDIELDYHFDQSMNTHVIDAINGEPYWWYRAWYSGGWLEFVAFRMDMHPYKNGTTIHFYKISEGRFAKIHAPFAEEVTRLAKNGGEIVLPSVKIGRQTFTDVKVVPHNIRSDMLQPGVVTALDVLLSLGERGEISRLKLTWYESITDTDPVDNYFVEQIDDGDGFRDEEAYGYCGWVYEVGSREFPGFLGSHIHIPADIRVLVSPDYTLWYWICI